MNDRMSDFAAFPPAPVIVNIAGNTLEITPIRVGEVPALVHAVRPFVGLLSADPDWLALLAEHSDALLSALALTVRRERAWVEGLSLDDAVRLAATVFEVNADFFVRRVAPKVGDLAQSLNGRLAGSTPSSA